MINQLMKIYGFPEEVAKLIVEAYEREDKLESLQELIDTKMFLNMAIDGDV